MNVTDLAAAFDIERLAMCRLHPEQRGQLGADCPECDGPYGVELAGPAPAPPQRIGGAGLGGEATGCAIEPPGATVADAGRKQTPPGQEAEKTGGGGRAVALRWGRRDMRPARIVWQAAGDPLATVLHMAAATPGELVRVFLLGARPGGASGDPEGFHRWVRAVPEGWAAGDHYTHDLMAPVLRYTGPRAERVEVLRAAAWFGEETDTAPHNGEVCGEAFRRLTEALAGLRGAQLLRTPSATGRHLLQRLIPEGVAWPVLDPDLQSLIRSTSGQGRFEVFPPVGTAALAGVTKYDMRFAYAAVGRSLGAGPARHLRYGQPACIGDVWPDDERAYWPARYLVEGTVPRGWGHVGLLPVKAGDASWAYPARGRYRGWVDGAELHVAVKAGWSPKVAEVLAFTPTPGAGPLGGWMDQLRGLRDRMADDGPGRLASAAVRSILLHSVGALHGTPHRVSRSVPVDQAHQVNVEELRGAPELVDGHVTWTAHEAQAWPEMAHPEWSSRIWAKTRARMAARLLTVPRDQVVAVQLDAIYTAGKVNGWLDDGKVGTFRQQGTAAGPFPAPRNLSQLHGLMASAS